ncbi:dihydrodipicolinate synthase [Cordyceps fumosorosea ARSEF 2679]|uniref:Dihydrodipicolinate synthase n=1 Tax=Cordyceps fumosorosea (strain ARSEF 2679) TaxID=1081104 RepID=A0A168BY32_CORFA|nr:dihydrodipicolinate synthase [Cordyceps fumosorosea ARSEF 2679]OAA70696.1 dihydrodipicolinate synthase [Cordyceps fumosorosea ARSEF 2679]
MSPSAFSSTGNGGTSRPLTRGIYVPTVAFFDADTEDLDTKTTGRHAVRLAKAGVAGIAVQGSNGEAVHLLREERVAVTQATRQALDAAGFTSTPLIVGCGAQSTLEAVRLCQDAAAAGGDYALVLPPSYYCGLFDGAATVTEFFTAVADASPIPILVYNYPGATPGVDLGSDTLAALARHPNVAGCKFTCGNTGKLGRVAAAARAAGDDFLCFAGSADFTLPALAAGGAGVIGGLANVAPRACVRVFDVAEKEGVLSPEAVRLQEVVARGDWVAIQTGVVGVKAALNEYAGYGGFSRRPLPRPDAAKTKVIADGLKELMELENSLQDKA